jgi:hypothetical protein
MVHNKNPFFFFQFLVAAKVLGSSGRFIQGDKLARSGCARGPFDEYIIFIIASLGLFSMLKQRNTQHSYVAAVSSS